MFGTMLSRISKEETPGYPAPEIACMVVIMTHSRGPKAFSRALRGIETPVVEQFALVTMNPFERGGDSRDCWWGMMEKCSGLTKGTMSGQVGSRR